MRTLGIIGGIAPPSTLDYYRRLTSRYRERSPDRSYPRLLIDSLDGRRFLAMLAAGEAAPLIELLVTELGRLAAAGADVALFASNTPHAFFDQIVPRSPLPLISIVEATADVAAAQGLRRVGLIGARYTMERDFYPAVFARRGITVVVPEATDRDYVHDRYLGELAEGIFRENTREGMLAVIDRLRQREAIEAVILGGTELPLLLRDDARSAVPMLDTTAIHVDAAIARLLE